MAQTTLDTSPRNGSNSSPSAALQSCLENRLRVRLEGRGSTIYAHKWKHWDMPSGLPILARRASVRRMSAKDYTLVLYGWGTPSARDHKDGSSGGKVPINGLLGRQVWTAGWGTPLVNDAKGSKYAYGRGSKTEIYLKLPGQAATATWPKCESKAWIVEQLEAFGQDPIGCFAEMPRSARLNPEHSRWLMGLPREWRESAPMETP